MRRGLWARALAVSLIAAMAAGCGKDKSTGPGDPVPFSYPAMDTPQHTLLNLRLAWERRDSIRTRAVYADDYMGMSQQPVGPPLSFSKDQEVATVRALGLDPEVTVTDMHLPPESTWVRQRFQSDPEGWVSIQFPAGMARLEVISASTTYRAGVSEIEFKFEPILDSTSPTDTTWKVVRWTEIVP